MNSKSEDLLMNNDIQTIHAKFKTGESSPVDLSRECIDRIKELNIKYKAFVSFDENILMDQATRVKDLLSAGGGLRLLEGIPVGIKDIFNTMEFPTQMGSPLWKGFTPGNDARTVFYVKQQGGILPGKTVTAEFAVHTLGETLNPHDVTKTPGTSSSGSAVGIALKMFPVSLATQTAGSIVRPASYCGVYGCKPSFGLIPRTGTLKTTDSLDTIGFFSYYLDDLKRMFDVLRVQGPDYPISYHVLKDQERQIKPECRPWRVALVKTHTWNNALPYARKSLLDFAEKISIAGDIEVVEADLPMEMDRAHGIHATIYNKTLSYYFNDEYEKKELVSPIMNQLIEDGKRITVDQYHKALKDQEKLAHLMNRFLDPYDVMISLSTAGEAPPRDEVERMDPALMWTMTHLPVISAPAFVSPAGLPFGVQLVARRYNDLLLFRFAEHLQERGAIPKAANPALEI